MVGTMDAFGCRTQLLELVPCSGRYSRIAQQTSNGQADLLEA
jgi:hypothetical protein